MSTGKRRSAFVITVTVRRMCQCFTRLRLQMVSSVCIRIFFCFLFCFCSLIWNRVFYTTDARTPERVLNSVIFYAHLLATVRNVCIINIRYISALFIDQSKFHKSLLIFSHSPVKVREIKTRHSVGVFSYSSRECIFMNCKKSRTRAKLSGGKNSKQCKSRPLNWL